MHLAMKYEIREVPGRVVVALAGEIDLDASPELRELLLCRIEGDLHVDLREVQYIDSSGIATLVEALQAARRQGSDFALAGISEPVARVLELARLDQVFTILDGHGDA